MRFRTPDEQTIAGRSYTAVVEAMAAEKFTEPQSLASYRKATANRAKEMYGVDVPHETDAEFVKGLENAGLLERVQ